MSNAGRFAGIGTADPAPMSVTVDNLEPLARQGDIDAQMALARHFESRNEHRPARGWYAQAARLGSVAALRDLALNLLTREPLAEGDGVNMIRSAADLGDAEAAHACAMLAAHDRRLENRWTVALECLDRAAQLGSTLARTQLDLLATHCDPANLGAATAARTSRTVFDAPKIAVVEEFATPALCDWLIARARPRMQRALVYDPSTGEGAPRDVRDNGSTTFDFAGSDMFLALMRERILATAGPTRARLEGSTVLHYRPGEQFAPHFDFLDPGIPAFSASLASEGQRVLTFLLYLNDDFDGGETDFPALGWRYRGRKGDALLFRNVTPEGAPDRQTLHAGLPTTRGEKWLLSQWIREPAVPATPRME